MGGFAGKAQTAKETAKEMRRKYLYSQDKAPIIVDENQSIEGWEDSPLPFVKTTDFNVDPKDDIKVQCLGESIMGVVDYCNGILNLELMDIRELRSFTSRHLSNIKARSKKALIAKIEAQNGNSSRHHQGGA